MFWIKSILLVVVCLFVSGKWSTSEASSRQVDNARELAILLEQSGAGDTLLIKGYYCLEESIIIDKPLVLIGIDRPDFDFQSLSSGFVIRADSVTLEGLVIHNIKRSSINDYAAIYAENADYICIRGNRVYNGFFGIYLAKSSHSLVENNYVEGITTIEQSTGNAVHMWQCDHMVVQKNFLSHHRDGVYLEFVTDSRVAENVSRENIRYGLHFMFSHDDEYENNKFLHNSAGVAVMYSRNVSMIGNLFQDNWGDCSYGLLLKDIYDGTLKDNVFERNTIALLMEGTNRLDVRQNAFTSNGWACKIAANCEGNVIQDNSFCANSFDVATNGQTVMNGFDGNYWDNYEGYDLDGDGIGDVPYHPVSLFSVLVERVPESLMLYRSFLTQLLDKSEHVMPSVTPSALVDNEPLMNIPETNTAYHASR